MAAPAGDVPSLTDFEGVGLMGEENPEEESDDSPECRESSSSDEEASSSSSTVRNSYQVILFRK